MLAAGTGALTAAVAAQASTQAGPACAAPVVDGATATVTCGYTGAAQYWTVPTWVTQATFTLYGAAGGSGTGPNVSGPAATDGGPGGVGAEVTGTLRVTPASVLQVNVGQEGAVSSGAAFGGGGSSGGGGASGGGGGGASDIRDGAYKLANRLLVAGGGGGGGAGGAADDEGGAVTGGAGGNAASPGGAGDSSPGQCDEGMSGGGAGGAGAAAVGGAGGAGSVMMGPCAGSNGYTAGSGAAGRKGTGGAGGGGGGPFGGGGGGAGGGYYGGGGGGGQTQDEAGGIAGAGGGGGGSSYTGTASEASVNDDPAGPPSTNGEVIITYAEALTSHSLSGHETAVSCLSPSLCVAVGSRHYHGVVVTLRNGMQRHALVLRRSSVIDSVSCRQSGCWAIGLPEHGHGAYLVKINSAGRPYAELTEAEPAAISLGPISCSSMTSCEIAGTDNHVHPAAIEVGTWTGATLRLHRVPVAGTSFVTIPGISCWHGTCVAVGYTRIRSRAKNNLILRISRGRPGALFDANNGFYITSVSCVSATTCYASGGAKLYTITNGVPGNQQLLPGAENSLGLTGIECVGTVCEAAGEEMPGTAWVGVLVSLSDGTAGTPTFVTEGSGFTGIATRAGVGFVAIGPGPGGSGLNDTGGHGTVDTIG